MQNSKKRVIIITAQIYFIGGIFLMEFIQKIVDFINFMIQTIKDLVASVRDKNDGKDTGEGE